MADGIGYNDMMRMQSEAVQRVREMQRRAQNAVQKANAQRAGRAQEKSESKGEALKHSAPPLNNNARATALPLDYITNKPSRSDTTQAHHSAPIKETVGKSPEKTDEENPSSESLSDNLDRLLVVALILLLSQQEADELLLMALGYLII